MKILKSLLAPLLGVGLLIGAGAASAAPMMSMTKPEVQSSVQTVGYHHRRHWHGPRHHRPHHWGSHRSYRSHYWRGHHYGWYKHRHHHHHRYYRY
ncbi:MULTISPECIES: hypothetical protein [unclassified Rhizobium]|uniref:hypothetical protein n=1 Tax=unclassified Rhizobium TaxID=2613769 RepID=UPI000EA9EB1F|nr:MULTISPECIES: hypothetical protein [unclassified Rhizobium]AYG69379.1 hypothetical protein CCGE531_25505 [Rhizobium sp. CCGE531]AYG75760.1 hypothetical protein CCGE532_25020 [Rhizobium sp. CCGE532]